MQLPDSIQIADGSLLHVQGGGNAALTVATDEDWAECLVAARLALSRGSKAIPDGATWEEGLAAVAAWYLRCGVGQIAMGRDPDADAWDAQRERWIELTHAEADKGPYALVRGYQNPAAKRPILLTRGDVDALPPEEQGALVPVWYEDPEPTVLTEGGRVPFADLPRSER